MFVTYLRSSGLEELLPHLETEKEALEIWRKKLQQKRVDAGKVDISPEEKDALYTYSVLNSAQMVVTVFTEN